VDSPRRPPRRRRGRLSGAVSFPSADTPSAVVSFASSGASERGASTSAAATAAPSRSDASPAAAGGAGAGSQSSSSDGTSRATLGATVAVAIGGSSEKLAGLDASSSAEHPLRLGRGARRRLEGFSLSVGSSSLEGCSLTAGSLLREGFFSLRVGPRGRSARPLMGAAGPSLADDDPASPNKPAPKSSVDADDGRAAPGASGESDAPLMAQSPPSGQSLPASSRLESLTVPGSRNGQRPSKANGLDYRHSRWPAGAKHAERSNLPQQALAKMMATCGNSAPAPNAQRPTRSCSPPRPLGSLADSALNPVLSGDLRKRKSMSGKVLAAAPAAGVFRLKSPSTQRQGETWPFPNEHQESPSRSRGSPASVSYPEGAADSTVFLIGGSAEDQSADSSSVDSYFLKK